MIRTLTLALAFLFAATGQAIDFDGSNDYITFGDITAWDGDTSQTVFIRLSTSGLNGGTISVFRKNGSHLALQRTSTTWRSIQWTGGRNDFNGSSSSVLTTGAWQTHCITYNGSNRYWYRDDMSSSLHGPDSDSGGYNNSSDAFYLGGNATSESYTGRIAHVQIFDTALNEAERTAVLFGMNGIARNQIGWWTLMEASGSNLTHVDLSPNSNNGTGTNGAAGTSNNPAVTWHSYGGG